MSHAPRIVVVLALASVGIAAPRMMAGEQLGVIVDESTITSPTYQFSVAPGQAVGGPVFFQHAYGYPSGWTVSGVARLRWHVESPAFGYFPTGSLAFVPDSPQVSAISSGTFVDVTFNALPIGLFQPDPRYGFSQSFAHWSWSIDPAAAGLTLWPEFDIGDLTLTNNRPFPLAPLTYPLLSYSYGGGLYQVAPSPTSGAALIGALMLRASRRRRR